MNHFSNSLSIILLFLFTAAFFLGWILPEVPYINRISVKEAENLWTMFQKIINQPNLTEQDKNMRNELARKLTHAGYVIINYNEIIPPKYAINSVPPDQRNKG